MISTVVKTTEGKMRVIISNLVMELKKIRTGRAQSNLVEGIRVSYYGSEVPIRELATIAVPEPNLIQISPFDKNAIGDIENAIRNSDLGLSPINDGKFIRISLPQLTEERRIELAKKVKSIGEDAKISLRNTRKDSWVNVQMHVKDGSITEDEKYKLEKELNDLIDKMNREIDTIIDAKSEEIMKL